MEALSGDPGVPKQGVGSRYLQSNVAIGEYITPFATFWCARVVQRWTTTTTSFSSSSSTKGKGALRSAAPLLRGLPGRGLAM
jgi:hypothetical protein